MICLFILSSFTCSSKFLFTGIYVSFDREVYYVTEVPYNFTDYLIINITGQTDIDFLHSLIITFTDGSATRKQSSINLLHDI